MVDAGIRLGRRNALIGQRLNQISAPLGIAGRLRLPLVAASLCLLLAFVPLASAVSERTLTFHNLHTGETTTVTYKRNGQFIPEGLAQLNYVLRDWRRNESREMDPRLYDLVWEIYQQSGSRAPINIISAYRSPATNEMLRAQSNGVAQNSQHIQGNAIDLQFPDVDLTTLRNLALRMQIGGVGFYPNSGSPFVHVDTGSVRHWPRLSRNQLAAVFPEGHTLHIPSDGTPLPGYEEAQLAYQQRGNEVVALFGEPTQDNGTRLATLFGGAPANTATPAPTATAPTATQPTVVAAAAIAPTVITALPPTRPDLPGVTVAEPTPRVDALAFAPETVMEPDPLDRLNETNGAVMTAAIDPAAALAPAAPVASPVPPIQRNWFDPLAVISAPSLRGTTLPFLSNETTTRQMSFARLLMPYVDASPQFLAKPDRIMPASFLEPTTVAGSHRFVITTNTPLQMIDLTRLGTVAQLQ